MDLLFLRLPSFMIENKSGIVVPHRDGIEILEVTWKI